MGGEQGKGDKRGKERGDAAFLQGLYEKGWRLRAHHIAAIGIRCVLESEGAGGPRGLEGRRRGAEGKGEEKGDSWGGSLLVKGE